MELQTVLNSFASDVFRRQADFDYVAARMNFKMRFRQQFLWSAQQAIEKYLKAILLYNSKSARYYAHNPSNKKKELGHNLNALSNEVSAIEYLRFELPTWGEEFLAYLSELGGFNRYMSKSSYSIGDELVKLDELVWHIRRYCKFIADRGLGCKNPVPGMKEAIINTINHETHKLNPHKYKLMGGDLEKILARPSKDPAKRALVWANLYYGKRKKNVVTFRPMSSSEIPPNQRSWFREDSNKELIAEYIKI